MNRKEKGKASNNFQAKYSLPDNDENSESEGDLTSDSEDY